MHSVSGPYLALELPVFISKAVNRRRVLLSAEFATKHKCAQSVRNGGDKLLSVSLLAPRSAIFLTLGRGTLRV